MNYDLDLPTTTNLDQLTMAECHTLVCGIYAQLKETGYDYNRDRKLIALLINLTSNLGIPMEYDLLATFGLDM